MSEYKKNISLSDYLYLDQGVFSIERNYINSYIEILNLERHYDTEEYDKDSSTRRIIRIPNNNKQAIYCLPWSIARTQLSEYAIVDIINIDFNRSYPLYEISYDKNNLNLLTLDKCKKYFKLNKEQELKYLEVQKSIELYKKRNSIYYDIDLTVQEESDTNIIWSSTDRKIANIYLEMPSEWSNKALDIKAKTNQISIEFNDERLKLNPRHDLPILENFVELYLNNKEVFSKLIQLENGYVYNGKYYSKLEDVCNDINEDITYLK